MTHSQPTPAAGTPSVSPRTAQVQSGAKLPPDLLQALELEVAGLCQQALIQSRASVLGQFSGWFTLSYLDEEWAALYLRVQLRVLEGHKAQCLTLANVEVLRPGMGVGTALFRAMLAFAEEHHLTFFVENVFPDGGMPVLVERFGLTRRDQGMGVDSFYRLNPASLSVSAG